MIRSVTVTNEKNESLTLELTRPEKSGLIIKSIDGLGPGKANINTSSLYSVDGGIYNSARRAERNIVIKLQMMFSPTIEDARQKTYRYFNIKKKVKLTIVTDNRASEITGYVESNEPDIFSKEETAQISILCPDPWFYSIGENKPSFFGIQGEFEFPFENASLTEPQLIFGIVKNDNRTNFYYGGDVDTGMLIDIFFRAAGVPDILLVNTVSHEQMKIYADKLEKVAGAPITSGDNLVISTVSGNKYARLFKDGVYINALSAIDKNSDWLKMSKGDNILAYQVTEKEEDLYISFSYKVAYSGI